MRAYRPLLVLLASICVFALYYGSTSIDEPLRAAALGGLVLILLVVALASGERIRGTRVQEETA